MILVKNNYYYDLYIIYFIFKLLFKILYLYLKIVLDYYFLSDIIFINIVY